MVGRGPFGKLGLGIGDGREVLPGLARVASPAVQQLGPKVPLKGAHFRSAAGLGSDHEQGAIEVDRGLNCRHCRWISAVEHKHVEPTRGRPKHPRQNLGRKRAAPHAQQHGTPESRLAHLVRKGCNTGQFTFHVAGGVEPAEVVADAFPRSARGCKSSGVLRPDAGRNALGGQT